MQDEIFKDYGMEPKPGLGNMWANINYPGSYNKQHIHPNSQWSGVYYVKVPEELRKIICRRSKTWTQYYTTSKSKREYPEPYGVWSLILRSKDK